MTVNADQARMLTTLGLAVRPYAAPRFDGRGLHTQILKVERMSLHEVALVVLAVCADPTLDTPANIGDTKSRHWAGIHVVGVEAPARDVAPVGSRCTVCGEREQRCRSRWALDHEFARPIERDVDLTPVVAELKGHIAPTKPASEPVPTAENPRVTQARELLHPTHTKESHEVSK